MTENAYKTLLAPLVLGLVALIAVGLQEPLLAPSLASGLFSQVTTPEAPSAKVWNISIGQFCGVAGGFIGVWLTHAGASPHFFLQHRLVMARVAAIAIAAFVTLALQHALRATTPAGGATAVVVALGAETADWRGFGHLAGGIVLITALGEIARLIVLRKDRSSDPNAAPRKSAP